MKTLEELKQTAETQIADIENALQTALTDFRYFDTKNKQNYLQGKLDAYREVEENLPGWIADGK